MENNQPVAPTQPVTAQQTTPTQPVNTAPQASGNVVTDQKEGDSKKKLWIILALILLILIGTGAYFMMNRKPATPTQPESAASTNNFETLNTELKSTEVSTTELDADLTTLDKDLSELK